MGFDDLDYKDRPVVAILNTWSELNTCHSHFRNRAEEVRRGILQSGGFPVEVPVMSLGEMLMKPTTMLYRNLLAMEVEEVLRCHPIDSAVLMGGCDKTTPGVLMGAISMNLPSIYVPGGAMLRGHWRGEHWAAGPMSGNTGPKGVPAIWMKTVGTKSKMVLHVPQELV